jgi:putative membrane protein
VNTNFRLLQFARLVLTGIAIGLFDLVPGISGSTLAFIFGIWQRLIQSLVYFFSACKLFLKLKFAKGIIEIRLVEWSLVVPVATGIVLSLLVGASVIGVVLEEYPQSLRAFFLGLVLGIIPLAVRQLTRWSANHFLLFCCGLVLSGGVSILPLKDNTDPSLLVIFFAAMISICATLLPGLSGSFLLLIFGLYDTLIEAIRNRDLVICLVFIGGAWSGTLLFTSRINWLLLNHREATWFFLCGLMIGGLNVLWPWANESTRFAIPNTIEAARWEILWFGVGVMVAIAMRRLTKNSVYNTVNEL